MTAWEDADFVRDDLEQRGPEQPRREPRAGDPVWVRGERRTVLAVTDTLILTDDDAGLRLQLPRSRMWWDGAAFRVAV